MPLQINQTHDAALRSWVESANDPAGDFPIQNLPLVQFESRATQTQNGEEIPERFGAGFLIGDHVLDLQACVDEELIGEGLLEDLGVTDLVEALFLVESEPAAFSKLRAAAVDILRNDGRALKKNTRAKSVIVVSEAEVNLFPPVERCPNYTDFYASIHHATTVGSMFRPEQPLLANYKWVPIGYHGRASSVIASGSEVARPSGQLKQDDAPGAAPTPPTFGPCKMLDYELEVGVYIGRGNPLGIPVAIDEAEEHMFGLVLVNDWSARDIQKWEYQPLGPFLAKNFATSVSCAVVTMEALAPFRVEGAARPDGDPQPLEYLRARPGARHGFDITLEAHLSTAQMREKRMSPALLSRGSFRDMYWTLAQLVTHHASGGCNLQPGDLLASGTVSGAEPGARGCLLELTWQGRDGSGKPLPRKPIALPSGESRTFLQDGDEVILKGYCEREGFRRIGLGECRGLVVPGG
ncbi:MAG: fumarylacetoacetase [Planctomycetota bacterium]|nr:fumarylacetoacetase [Planctomycetota bacterium]